MSDEPLVTAAEASAETGVPIGTIYSAASRDLPDQPGVKQLAQWGIDTDGRTKLYRLSDVRALAHRTRRRRTGGSR